MSQNPPYYPMNGLPSIPSTSQAPQTVSTSVAPTMQSQQTAFQPNAALPSSNPMAMIAQMGLNQEQLMQLAQLIQSGAFAGGPVAPAPAQPAAPASLSNAAPQMPPTQQLPPAQVNAEDVDMDKEEGEVDEEEEIKNTAAPRGFLKTPPKGPRKRSRSPKPRFGESSRSSQPRVRSPVPVSASRRSSAYGGSETMYPGAVSNNGKAPKRPHHETVAYTSTNDKRETVKDFLKEMHKAGFSYDEFAKIVGYPELFKTLWDDIGLPRQPTAGHISTQATTVPEPAKAPIKKIMPPKPAPQQDRLAYLAKLQAAKNKKPESTPSPLQAKPAEESKPIKEKAPAPAVASASSTKDPQPAKRVLDKELIRQRLEALKAHQAEKDRVAKAAAEAQAAATAAEPVLDEPQDDEDFDGAYSPAQAGTSDGPSHFTPQNLGDSPSAIQPQAPTPSATNGAPGLPGLFAPGLPSTQAPHLETAEHFAQSAQQQQHHTPTYPLSSAQNWPTTAAANVPKRPFGISRHASHDEAFVIIDSDEESEDAAKTGGNTAEVQDMRATRTNPMNAFPVLYNNSPNIQSPAPHIPATPNSASVHKDLAELKKQLAEKERLAAERHKRRMAALDNNATPSVSASEAGTPAQDHEHGPKFGDATSLLKSSAAFDEREHANHKLISSNAEPSANSAQDSFTQTAETQYRPTDTNTASRVLGTPGLPAAPQVVTPATDVEPSKPIAPLQTNDDDEDMEIDDDDDLDDIYEQSGPLASSVPPAVDTIDDDQDDVDTESAMDTSSDKTEESEEEYEPTDEPAEVATASLPDQPPEPQQPPPIHIEEGSSIPVEGNAYSDEEDAAVDTKLDVDAVEHPERGPQLQPTEQEVADPPAVPIKLTAYVSPLRIFKDYRYHPQFLDTVPGGFKSLTYTHKIDAIKVVCPFETAGGKCNDATCEFQHFKHMALSDNELLKLMGADQIPAKEAEDIAKWKKGLAALITTIRKQNQGRDVEAISKRIAEYRREFLGDASKTLLLD